MRVCRTTIFLLLFLLLSACAEAAEQPPPTPTPLAITPFAEVVDRPSSAVVTAGYVFVDGTDARLVDGISFSSGPTPSVITPTSEQVWLNSSAVTPLESALRGSGEGRYAAVLVRGRLEGPGAYGKNGTYRYQIADAVLTAIAPQETTLPLLLEHTTTYQGQFVRVNGYLLARPDSAVLVEQIGQGGVPAPRTQQIKLRAPIRDTALLEHLQLSRTGNIHFGQVQIEGFWQTGVLVPLSLLQVI